MSRGGVLARVAALGASTQAAVPALYAWALTVRPLAFARGAGLAAQVAGGVAAVALVGAPLVDRRRPGSGRRILLLGGLGASALAWALAPRGVTVGPTSATLGALGWGLFAFALAGPVVRRGAAGGALSTAPGDAPREDDVVPLDPPGAAPRAASARSWVDRLYLACGVALAVALGGASWDAATPERATLVRVVAVTAGVVVLDAASSLAVARHTPRKPLPLGPRLRRALPWAVAIAALSAAGLALLGSTAP